MYTSILSYSNSVVLSSVAAQARRSIASRPKIHAPKIHAMPVHTTKRKASASPPAAAMSKVKKEDSNNDASAVYRFDPLKPLPDDASWPAPAAEMVAATAFLRRLLPSRKSGENEDVDGFMLSSEHPLVILPDKDCDGLCSGQILHRTLEHLGVSPDHIRVQHRLQGSHGSSSAEYSEHVKAFHPAACVLLDQGSQPGPPLLGSGDTTPVLVIDHHFSKVGNRGPEGSLMVNACHSPPVATASLLTWTLCRPLWTDSSAAEKSIDWLAILGTTGDLGVDVKFEAPMPDFAPQLRKLTKKTVGTANSLLNAPRRTPRFEVSLAYDSLTSATTPAELLDFRINKNAAKLEIARQAVREESNRCSHAGPKFTKDGRVAVLIIDSQYQVHPLVAAKWSSVFRGTSKLQVIMCANVGFSLNGTHTHFSCRIAKSALKRGETPNIIEILHDYAARDPTFLSDVTRSEAEFEPGRQDEDINDKPAVEAVNFARGHKEASGGVSTWVRGVLLPRTC